MEECVSLHISPCGNAAIGVSGEEDYSISVIDVEEHSVAISAICEILHFLNASVNQVLLSPKDRKAVFRLLSDSAWQVEYNHDLCEIESAHEIGSSVIVLNTEPNEELNKVYSIKFANAHGEELTLPVIHRGEREEFLTADNEVFEVQEGQLFVIQYLD